MECKAGSGSPLYLMMQKRYETEVTKLSQNNPSFVHEHSKNQQQNFIQIM